MRDDTSGALRYHTLRTLRRHPDLPKWISQHGTDAEDTAHREVVEKFLGKISRLLPNAKSFHGRSDDEDPYELATNGPSRSRHEADPLGRALDWAANWIDHDQGERLAQLWTSVTSGPVWDQLTPAARWLYRLVHAVAQEDDKLGGSSVLLSNRAAQDGIEILGGPCYRSLATISKARKELVRHGLIAVEVGKEWTKGERSKPTRYTLPLDLSELSHAAAWDSSLEPVPALTILQREQLELVFTGLRQRKAGQSEPVLTPEPEHQLTPDPMPEPDQGLFALLDHPRIPQQRQPEPEIGAPKRAADDWDRLLWAMDQEPDLARATARDQGNPGLLPPAVTPTGDEVNSAAGRL